MAKSQVQNNIGVHEEYIPVVRNFGVNPQNRELCDNGHKMVLKTTTPYRAGFAVCRQCRGNITKDQIKKGYYNCAIDKSDYHRDLAYCVAINEKRKEEIKKNRDKNYSSPTRLDVNQFDQNENENHFIESIGTLGNKRKKGDHAESGENKTSHELKKINDKRHDEK